MYESNENKVIWKKIKAHENKHRVLSWEFTKWYLFYNSRFTEHISVVQYNGKIDIEIEQDTQTH